MIDLSKLEYGTDYYALPPNNIVFITDYNSIIKKLHINKIQHQNIIKFDENNISDVYVI